MILITSLFEDIEIIIKDKNTERKGKINQEWPDQGIRIEKARWGRSNIIKGIKKLN